MKKYIADLVLNGFEVSKGSVEIYNMEKYNFGRNFSKTLKIQVYSKKHDEYCGDFYNINDAVDKFLELV